MFQEALCILLDSVSKRGRWNNISQNDQIQIVGLWILAPQTSRCVALSKYLDWILGVISFEDSSPSLFNEKTREKLLVSIFIKTFLFIDVLHYLGRCSNLTCQYLSLVARRTPKEILTTSTLRPVTTLVTIPMQQMQPKKQSARCTMHWAEAILKFPCHCLSNTTHKIWVSKIGDPSKFAKNMLKLHAGFEGPNFETPKAATASWWASFWFVYRPPTKGNWGRFGHCFSRVDRDFSSISGDLMRFHGVWNARNDHNDRHDRDCNLGDENSPCRYMYIDIMIYKEYQWKSLGSLSESD